MLLPGADLAGERQVDMETATGVRACVDRAFNADITTQVVDNTVDQRQSQAGSLAGFLGGKKRLEDLFNQVLVNAAALVDGVGRTPCSSY